MSEKKTRKLPIKNLVLIAMSLMKIFALSVMIQNKTRKAVSGN